MDDVDSIQKNGKIDSFIFIADSSKRDTSVYPHPNEYEIVFNSQFRNVVGFEILEVNVPRTDYIVDSLENQMTYSIDIPTSITTWSNIANLRTVTFDVGDYNLPQLVDEMNQKLNNVSNAYGDTITLRVLPTTNPSEISNKIRIESSGPFCFLGDQSSIRSTIGFGDPVEPTFTSSNGIYSIVPGYTTNFPNGASNVFIANPGVLGNGETFSTFVGPIPSADNTSFEGIYGSRKIQQYFQASTAGNPVSVGGYLKNIGTAPAGGFVANVTVNYANGTTIAAGNIISINDDMISAVTSKLTVTSNFVQGQTYYVEYTPTGTTDAGNCAALWYNQPNLPLSPGAYAAINGMLVHNGSYFCTDVVSGAYGYEMTAPGIVNLRGARYIKIRIPEIEQYIYRDRVGEPTTAGMGLVNLIGYGFQQSRFNFVGYPAKQFHPIGKLQKLTIRLERPDGSLYDSNGVDNFLLCAIKYVSVPNKAIRRDDEPYPANPAYDSDIINLNRTRWVNEMNSMQRYLLDPGACAPGGPR